MTREEAMKLIPPGWVVCDERGYERAAYLGTDRMVIGNVDGNWLYVILAPKEPRRVPCGEMALWCDNQGRPSVHGYWKGLAALEYANTKWHLEVVDGKWWWVEVME